MAEECKRPPSPLQNAPPRRVQMVLLLLTDPLIARLQHVVPQLPAELAAQLSLHLDSVPSPTDAAPTPRTISHEVLVRVSRWAKAENLGAPPSSQRRDELTPLRHSRPVLPSPPNDPARATPPSPYPRTSFPPHITPLTSHQSPQLLAILSALQLAQDEASYASMTSLHEPQIRSLLPLNDVHEMRKGGKERTVAEEWAEVRREVGAIVNVGASMLAVGVAIWWVGGGRSYADVRCLELVRGRRGS